MKLELNKFIKEVAAGDESFYLERGNYRVLEKFSEFLGFKRWNTPILRPDNDPKWTPFRWSIGQNAYVKNVRVMTFNRLYSVALKECTEKDGITFPNDWKVAELVDTLIQLRKEYKAGFLYGEQTELYSACQMIAKILLNGLYYIIGNHGSGLSVGMGCHNIVQLARDKVTAAVKKISETATVLYVNTDEIIYFGNQVEFDNVHHERYNTAIILDRSAAYGNDIRVSSMPVIRLDMKDWNPSTRHIGTFEEQTHRTACMIGKRITRFRISLNDYINTTKEQIDAKNSLDDECNPL